MERNLWLALYEQVQHLACPGSHRPVQHTDRWIVLTYLWAALHDRPTVWATTSAHWPKDLGPMNLPSQSTMSRRLRTASVRQTLHALAKVYRGNPAMDWVKYIDGKPLPVGDFSKDPDAKVGRGPDFFYKGYKLHAIYGRAAMPLAWEVRPANASEPTTARLLVQHLAGEGYLVGDRGYDSNPLAEAAGRRGHQLVAPPKKEAGAGQGHHPQSPYRLRGLALLQQPFGKALYRSRAFVERCYGHLTSFGGGLGSLPPWVRRQYRVRQWVEAKLILYAARVALLQRLTT